MTGPLPGAGADTSADDTPADDVLQLQPLIHVEDMASAVSFYQALGARVLHDSRDGDFTLLELGGTEMGLLAHPPNPDHGDSRVELNFGSQGSLETLEQRLRTAGVIIAAPTIATGFGEQLQLLSPDGLRIKINRLQPKRYS